MDLGRQLRSLESEEESTNIHGNMGLTRFQVRRTVGLLSAMFHPMTAAAHGKWLPRGYGYVVDFGVKLQ